MAPGEQGGSRTFWDLASVERPERLSPGCPEDVNSVASSGLTREGKGSRMGWNGFWRAAWGRTEGVAQCGPL